MIGNGEYQRRRKEIFSELLNPELGALFRTALRMTRNREDAEDLVQETVTKLFAAIWTKGTNFHSDIPNLNQHFYK